MSIRACTIVYVVCNVFWPTASITIHADIVGQARNSDGVNHPKALLWSEGAQASGPRSLTKLSSQGACPCQVPVVPRACTHASSTPCMRHCPRTIKPGEVNSLHSITFPFSALSTTTNCLKKAQSIESNLPTNNPISFHCNHGPLSHRPQ